MALQEQQISFRFAGGVETKADEKSVPGTRLLALENGVFTRAISIQKRNGYDLLSRAIDGTTDLVTGAKRLAVRDTELLQFTNAKCYSKQSEVDKWIDAGAIVAPTGEDRAVVHTGTQQSSSDHASKGGVTAYAWEDSLGGVYWTVVDENNGRVYRAPTQAHATGQRPRCVAVGDVIHIYYVVPTLQTIYALIVNPETPSAALTAVAVVEDIDSTNSAYDAVPTTRTGTPAFIAWHEHATTNARIGYVTAGGLLGSPVSGHPSAFRYSVLSMTASSPLACAYKYVDGVDADRLFIAYDGAVVTFNGGTSSTPIASTSAVAGYAAPSNVKRIALAEANGYVWAAFEEHHSTASKRYCVVNSVVVDGAAGIERTIRSVGLASRAFHAGATADVFAVFLHDTTYFNTYLTLRLSDFAPAGRHLPGAAAVAPTRSHLSSAYVTDDIVTIVLPYRNRLESTNNDKFTETGLRKITLDFDSEDSHQYAQIGRGLYLAGACLQHYDGRIWTEQGFHVGPETITETSQAGGSLTVSSTYSYKAWYEWTDAQGEVHRGPESVGTTAITSPGDTQVTLTLPTLRVTRKSNVRIGVGRCLPGDTSRFWRVSSLDQTTASDAANGYIANDTTVDTVTFVDRISDTNLQLQEPLYTTGGVLSNDPAPLGSHVTGGKNRLFFTDAQAGSVIRFSQRLATGFGLECAPELQHDIDPFGGDITALATMDDVVFVFKAGAIFAFNGDGPYETGSTTSVGPVVNGFSSSQIITSDVGCTDPSSIVLTPDGLMFKSAKGIYLIDRGRQVTYAGAPVETYNTQNVRRAVVLPDRTAVLFLTDSGSTLYYDYLFKQWSTFTNHEGYDAAIVDGSLYYLRTNDIVFKETVGEYSDGGARITLRFETAWLHLLEHLQGFQRFWKLLLLGTWVSPHQLGIQYRMNYVDAWTDASWLDATGDTDSDGWITGDGAATIGLDPITGTAYGEGAFGAGVYGGTPPDEYQWRCGIHEAGQSIQFRFEDFEKAGLAGASFELTEMTIIGGVQKPDYRPFSAARGT